MPDTAGHHIHPVVAGRSHPAELRNPLVDDSASMLGTEGSVEMDGYAAVRQQEAAGTIAAATHTRRSAAAVHYILLLGSHRSHLEDCSLGVAVRSGCNRPAALGDAAAVAAVDVDKGLGSSWLEVVGIGCNHLADAD